MTSDLTPKQEKFCQPLTQREINRILLMKLAALRKMSEHLGMLSTCKALQPSPEELQRRIDEHGIGMLIWAFLVIHYDPSPIGRSAAGLMLEYFCPDWRKHMPLSMVGRVVERNDSEVRIWRKTVLGRDGYVCNACGSQEKLEVHHIVRWVDAPDLRIDPDNGITLCCSCHDGVHAGGLKTIKVFQNDTSRR